MSGLKRHINARHRCNADLLIARVLRERRVQRGNALLTYARTATAVAAAAAAAVVAGAVVAVSATCAIKAAPTWRDTCVVGMAL